MTRKKKEIEKMSKDTIKNRDKPPSNVENTESKDVGVSVDKEEEGEQEIKLLEGEEQKVLEYHDFDELKAKYNALKESNKKDKEALIKYQKESESWKNKHMRLQAEFENAQKRWNKNRQNLRTEYTGLTLKAFLPLYDSFKKALDGDDENKAILKQFYDQFISILKFHKAEPIEVKINDPFDYSYHEALSSIEKDDLPNNSIIEIIQDGWKMDKDVLRYAKVIVSREPPPPEPEPEPELEPEEQPEVKTILEDGEKDTEIINSEGEIKEDIEEHKEEKGEIENNNK
ncbi:MAG: nucleotide exchange factor GrpE [Candidatus Lokiarchaeota archaeon]|nr:nucleotide exchange factor GrpE [Candidatus Lokiarchaeota archaeon]